MAGSVIKNIRNGAKAMVAKTKTYGKKKGRDLASLFLDLSISPSKPGTNATTRVLAPTPDSYDEVLLNRNTLNEEERVLAPTPDSYDEALLNRNTLNKEEQANEDAHDGETAESEGEQAVGTADQDEDKENRPRRKAQVGKQIEKRTVSKQISPEISELTSLAFVQDEVADFQSFCKGWEKTVNLTKIGQGSFATVLKMELKHESGDYSVWKLMPLKPSTGLGSRPRQNQTLIKDAATEVRMLYAMSDIDGFVQFRSAHVIQGFVPNQICKAHESWAKTLRPDDTWYGTNLKAEYPSKNQLWLLMEMTDAGQDLDVILSTARLQESFLSIHETWDIFWGVAEALMRGEAQAEFEHRDLHPGNICIKLRDEPLDMTTEHGVPRLSKREVTLIDYTQSRLSLESGDVLATDVDESIFQQTDADPMAQRQYDAYRLMRDMVKKEKKSGVTVNQMWKEYVPVTNVLWLHCILTELMEMARRKEGSQEDLDMVDALLHLQDKLRPDIFERWEYRSAREVVSGFFKMI